jgi:hypothetical protein
VNLAAALNSTSLLIPGLNLTNLSIEPYIVQVQAKINSYLAQILQPFNTNFYNLTIDYGLADNVEVYSDSSITLLMDLFVYSGN